MRSVFCGVGALLLLIVAGLVSGPVGASSDEEIPTIKKVMKKLNQGKNAPIGKVKAALKGGLAVLGRSSERSEGHRHPRARPCRKMTRRAAKKSLTISWLTPSRRRPRAWKNRRKKKI